MPERKAGVTDYSKWENIELSDDESDVHPNIEKGTWFRLKHQQRVQREEQEAKDRAELAAAVKAAEEALAQLPEDSADRQKHLDIIEDAKSKVAKMDKNKKWNVDNICTVKEERTIVNHETSGHSDGFALPQQTDKDRKFLKDGVMSEDAKVHSYQEYCDRHKELLEEFGNLKTMDETRAMMEEHGDVLLQEHSNWYFLMACLEAEMAGQRDKMKRRCRQSQVLSSITELAKTEGRHPGNIIAPFFERLKSPERFSVFVQGVDQFAKRIEERAIAKKQEEALGLPPGGDVYSEGQVVEATGLKGCPELNGIRGEVKGRLKNGRVGVRFPEPFGEKAIKEDNLLPVPLSQLKEEQEEQERREKDPSYCWWLPNDMPREDRLGPGGLDPIEVFASLPRCLQDAFRSREMQPLHDAIAQLEPAEAEVHLKKCSLAGLWNPNGASEAEEEAEQPAEAKPAEQPKPKGPLL
ncbi:Hsp90 co-chaperone Cdc37 [Diplonema papillatum]|nr:Hsp90 co-chaperone Cdc37 [Diplonema papillatum]